MLIQAFILLILIMLNAFFAASEMALISLNDNKIRVMAEEGDKKAKLLSHLLSEPSRFLATIQIGITLAGFLVFLPRINVQGLLRLRDRLQVC